MGSLLSGKNSVSSGSETSAMNDTTRHQAAILDRAPIPRQSGGVAFGGYAGLSLRLAATTRSWTYSSSEGVNGEKATHGQPARWLDFSGKTTDGKIVGITILDHPANLRHPTPWYVNQDMPFFSPAMLFNRPHTLAAKTRLTLRYRMFIHSGLLSRAAIDQEWAEFGKR